jgi:hypothetical protein
MKSGLLLTASWPALTGLTEPVDSAQMWRDHDIIVPANADTGWMRVSCACFTLPEELERLVDLLRERQPAA